MSGLTRRCRQALVLVVVVVLLAGCGVPLQDEPQPLDVPSSAPATGPPEAGSLSVTIYLVRGDGLEATERSTPDTSLRTVLTLLSTGPSREESAQGIRTALLPESVDAESTTYEGGVVTVAVTDNFTRIFGDDQLMAAAQLVWTVTEGEPADRVRVTLKGDPIELPTDEGLTRTSVSRRDYLSVAAPEDSADLAAAPG